MRRTFLLGGAAAFSLFLTRAPQAATPRRLSLRHSGTGARFDGPWHDGQAPDPGAMRDLSAALADPGCDPPVPFDPDTIALMWEVATRTRLANLDIHSGYRTPRVNRQIQGAGDSQHLRASAVDIGVPGGRLPAVSETALKLGRGGVGVYRRRGFVHLDTGPVRSWSDGGSRANPREDTLSRIAAEWRRGTVRVDRF
jgi:uncharacterized protein YcbK (DUF882 family)